MSVGDTNTNSSSVPDNANVNGTTKPADAVFLPRPFSSNSSYSASSSSSSSSTDDDSSHETLAGASSVNSDSDSETIVSNGSKSMDRRNSSSATPSLFSNASVSSTKERIDEVPSSDRVLLEELQEMSSAERTKVEEEIHGVSTFAVAEDSETTVEGLVSLEKEIRAIRQEVLLSPGQLSSSGDSYDESIWSYLGVNEEISSASVMPSNNQKRLLYSYVFHRDFRLKFLRADLYDAKKAAHRYLRCVECLLKYYGTYALQRPLMYEDLGKECQDAAKAGFVQILPSRDRAGRLIVVCQPAGKEMSMSTIVKLFIYVFLVVSEDVETQKRGVIFIYSADEYALQILSDPEAKKEYSLYREGSTVRRSCTHFCLPANKPKMNLVRSAMMLAMPTGERIRTRIHMDGKISAISYHISRSCCIEMCMTDLSTLVENCI